jgi:hypothetical protein
MQFFSQIFFDLWLVNSVDVEPMDIKGWLYKVLHHFVMIHESTSEMGTLNNPII